MMIADCLQIPPCPHLVRVGLNWKCNFTGVELYIHLVKTCPREFLQGNIVEEHCHVCPERTEDKGVISCGLEVGVRCMEIEEGK